MGNVRIWLGILLSFVFLFLAVRKVPLSDLADSLADAELIWIVGALGLQVLALLPRAMRWLVILEPHGSFREAFASQNIGYLFNNIFPLRVGELARILIMSKTCGIPVVRVGTSVVLERIIDVIIVTLGLLFALSGLKIADEYLLGARAMIWLVIVVLILFVLFIRFYPRIDRLFRSILLKKPGKIGSRLLEYWTQAMNVVTLFSSAKYTLRLIAWFMISWLLSVALYWCTFRAFVPNPTIREVILMISVLALSFLIPSSPGYLGVFQFVGQQALVIPFGLKYDPVTAFAIALTVHVIFYGITSFLGIIGVGRFGTSITRLRNEILVQPIQRNNHIHEHDRV